MLEIVLFNRNIEEPTTLFWNVYAGSILVWKMNVHPLMLTFTRDWYGAISLYKVSKRDIFDQVSICNSIMILYDWYH